MSNSFKIISGGQTGADRAALEFAVLHGLRHGGWCPKGRKAEDGVIPRRYRLKETGSTRYDVRTRWNVRDSEATVILSLTRRLRAGTKRTAHLARQMHKPLLVITPGPDARKLARLLDHFLTQHDVRILNVAGPRASEQPAIGQFVCEILRRSRWLGRFSKRPLRPLRRQRA
jgi:hypothetical protein